MFGQLLILLALGVGPDPCLWVVSVPSGLDVWVDGVYRGTSPVRVEGLPVGQHALRVSTTKTWAVQPFDTTVVLGPGITRVCATIPATLHVTTDPPGVVIFEDGREIGRSPLLLARPPSRRREISLRHGSAGTRTWEWMPMPGTLTTLRIHYPPLVQGSHARSSRWWVAGAGCSSLAMATGSVLLARAADEAYADYCATANPDRATRLFRRAQRLDRWASGLWTGFELSVVALLVMVATR